MANQKVYLKYRDTKPILEATLRDPPSTPYGTGTLHDLTGQTAHIHVWLDGGSGTKLELGDMVVDPDPLTGKVYYPWTVGDWASITPGEHRLEYEVRGPGADDRETFPNDGYDVLIVREDIGQDT